MNSCSAAAAHRAGIAFDGIAGQYDDIFTYSLIGRAQRDVVWEALKTTFRQGDRVLELNCGTGEDALFLSRMGVSVYGCDASERMIAVAERRMAVEPGRVSVQFDVRASEEIGNLGECELFDGAVSNFSGLNCVEDLAAVARQLARLVKPGGRLVLCLSTRFCLWETIWYSSRGDVARAVRRWKGSAVGSLGETAIRIQYPSLRDICRKFHPGFHFLSCRGVGVSVPPSYVEHLARKYPWALNAMQTVDRVISGWPLFRVMGDHMLLVFERGGR